MADRTQLKIADKNDFADEDPFAELTRIMGFDPRQPVVRQDVGAPAERVEPTVDDDFGIDLEKELLGELAGDDLVAEPAPAAYVKADEPAAYAPVESPVGYAPAEERSREPEFASPEFASPEFASDASFDDAVAASFEEFSLEDELLRSEEPAYAAEPAYEPAPEVSFAPEPNFAPEPAFAPEPDFDDAVAASFEQEFSMEDELLAADEPAEQVVAPVSYAASTEADLDAEFDVALADVDMDFAAVDDDSYAVEAVADDQLTLGEYQPAEPEVAFSQADLVEEPQAVAAPVAQAEDYDEFERRLQDALRDEEPVHEPAVAHAASFAEPVVEAPVHEPAVAPVAAPVAAVEDTSLEDELNALLGNMSSQAKALSEPVPLRVVEPVAAEPEPTFASSLWAPEQPVEELSPAYDETDYAPSYDAPVEEFVAAEEAAPVQADAGYSEPSYDHQADIDVSFDDDAFDMALERSAMAEVAEVAAPAVAVAAAAAAVPVRPLAASRYEQARSWGLGTPVAPRAETPVVAAHPGYQPEAIQKPDAYVSVAPTYVPQAEPVAYAPEAYAQPAEPEAYAQAEPAVDDLEAELFAAVSSFDDAPDIETVDVPEKAVALADDLDIPELSFEDDAPPAPAYDDLDGEFSNLMNEMNAPEVTKPAASSNYASNPYADGFDRKTLRDGDASQPIELAGAAAAGAAIYAGRQQVDDRLGNFDLGGLQQSQSNGSRQQAQADDFDYDPDFDEAMETLPGSPAARPARRGMMIAAIVGAVAVVGGIGAFALSFGGGEGAGAPVIVKADESPIKVKPENPGGATVPNQDNKVYDRVAGGSTNGAPAQDKLVTNAEEPVDLAAQEAEANMPENLPLNEDDVAAAPATAKSEERVAQTPQVDQPDASAETAAVAPRKVRTMVVRPDGTLVPREEPAPVAVAATEPTDPAPQRVAEPASEATGTVPAQPALAPVAKPAQSANTPSTAPIAPQRPSEQPVDVVGEVKPDQVAAVAPSAPTTAAASGAWAMQIASQPSEAAAKSTYADLARRYGSVLNGREVSIVKADIAGKGTFWRVRVPAGTRNDAVSLCESYKAAGGNCFVSK